MFACARACLASPPEGVKHPSVDLYFHMLHCLFVSTAEVGQAKLETRL